MNQDSENLPWYKQGWPWALIAIPVATLIAGVFTVLYAFNNQDPLVVDDYYKKGKAINLELSKVRAAKALNIGFDAKVTDSSFSLSFRSGEPAQANALTVNLYHPTLENEDLTLLLTADANGVYTASLEKPILGKRKVDVLSFDKSWKVSFTRTFPIEESFEVYP